MIRLVIEIFDCGWRLEIRKAKPAQNPAALRSESKLTAKARTFYRVRRHAAGPV
jgi:hypothetical protein